MLEKKSSGNYIPQGQQIVCRNGTRFYNRPLYGANQAALVLTGDLPQWRFVAEPHSCGYFMLAFVRDNQAKWLADFSEVTTYFAAGGTKWELQDQAFPEVSLVLETVCLRESAGFSVRLTLEGTKNTDHLMWAYGGVDKEASKMVFWELDPSEHPELVEQRFRPEACQQNQVTLHSNAFEITTPDFEGFSIAGSCTAPTDFNTKDAASWEDAGQLLNSTCGSFNLPLLVGLNSLQEVESEIYWVFKKFPRQTKVAADLQLAKPQEAFIAGRERVKKLAEQIQITTPDPYFYAGLAFLNSAIDAYYYPPFYVHGAMSWNWPYIGWRLLYGPTILGWGENVVNEAAYILAHQQKEAVFVAFKSDPELGYTLQASDSRYYGKGRIKIGTDFYNMQEVFFDQLIHSWRWTGSPELEQLLLKALPLHLEWQKECFDPDDDGVYESYLNVWASDSLWYNGGGTAQATAYAYTGRKAALELAERNHQPAAANLHKAELTKIRAGLVESLWIKERGYLAEYREAWGHRRRHNDACLYSVFLPIDAGVMNQTEKLQMLYYTEWGLERLHLPGGGQLCWTSNFVPYEWSVRELSLADSLHLALAYYQTGRGQSAWELLKGVVHEAMFNSIVPGGMVLEPLSYTRGKESFQEGRATDFADSVSMLARVTVEGLYGIQPDYPNGTVHCIPQFPLDWQHARIATPEFVLHFDRVDGVDRYYFSVAKAARLSFEFPVRTARVERVETDGREVSWKAQAGPDCTFITLDLSVRNRAEIAIYWKEVLTVPLATVIEGLVGERVELKSAWGEVLELADPQAALVEVQVNGSMVTANFSSNLGNHLVLVLVQIGNLQQWLSFYLNIKAIPSADLSVTARQFELLNNIQWKCLNIDKQFNADLRTIYQHPYVTPRPQTCSVQIGLDGFSPWTYYFWKSKPPVISFDKLTQLLDKDGLLWTPQAIPFRWDVSASFNTAFVSLWDNWPTSIEFEINRAGTIVQLLLAGSTNHMQTKIANAVIHFIYNDGEQETLELIHPDNYWSLSASYDYAQDAFALPVVAPASVELGEHCRAMLIAHPLRSGIFLHKVRLECLSWDVVVGLLGITIG